jgi:hypothetical protein
MSWESLATEPLDIDSEVGAVRARAIAAALARVAVPVLASRCGRAEPLASGALYDFGASLLLLTCRHLFDDGASVGDLGLPLGDTRRILWLRDARPRVLVDPQADLAAIRIDCRRSAGLLRTHWRTASLEDLASAARAQVFVLAGFPYSQMRRVGPLLHAKPVVVFARGGVADGQLRLNYRRIARRADGLQIHAPPLDGVSGATLWALIEDGRGSLECELQPAGVQNSFKHDAYVRADLLGGFSRLLRARMS